MPSASNPPNPGMTPPGVHHPGSEIHPSSKTNPGSQTNPGSEIHQGFRINPDPQIKWFDSFTKAMLTVMFVLLLFIFGAGKYMDSHKMSGGGTDDVVNNLASAVSHTQHHPFVDLPGDAQVGAFSVANFFAGLIVGHHWEKLFGKSKRDEDEAEV
ncbi:hypothetical protein CEB3_c07980 [Peptococcaceae bacterium CEB3]|nr:hypothetical protein CEB3_c07980 [Peptococcaceae bacterium CEB3]